jgi:hypothetical protein
MSLLLLVYLMEDTLDLFCTFYPFYVIISIEIEKFLELIEYVSRQSSLKEILKVGSWLVQELKDLKNEGLQRFDLNYLKLIYLNTVTLITLITISNLSLYFEYKIII